MVGLKPQACDPARVHPPPPLPPRPRQSDAVRVDGRADGPDLPTTVAGRLCVCGVRVVSMYLARKRNANVCTRAADCLDEDLAESDFDAFVFPSAMVVTAADEGVLEVGQATVDSTEEEKPMK